MNKLFKTAVDNVVDDKYSKKTTVPQYLPKNVKPHLAELINLEKYSKFISHINNSTISEEEKKFLRFAASRHIVFRYDKIADYYAHASKEMQELMEESALVIIDFDDAIANGYIELSKKISEICECNKDGS